MYLIKLKQISADSALTILIYGLWEFLSSNFFANAKKLKLYVLYNNSGELRVPGDGDIRIS